MKRTYPFARPLLATLFLSFFLLASIDAQDDKTESPFLNVTSEDSIGVNFALKSTDINATVSGVIANVIVEQTYINSGSSTVDATYVFPMSSNAAIYAMEMTLNDKTSKAEIKRRDEAQTIFDTANENGQTASLLEQQRANVFQMSLANINPGDSLKIRMVYTELLVPEKSIYQFVFPTIVGPRYTTGGESWVRESMADSLATSQTGLNFNLKINSGMPLQAECTSHNATFEYDGNSAQTIFSTNPGSDFIVDYKLDGDEIETGLLLYEGEEENFFLSIIQPARPEVQFDSPPREYVFIMDVSGSMNGTPLDISKDMIINLLNDLNFDDRFNIIFFAGGSSVLSPNSLEVNSENIEMAVDMIENQRGGGGTQLLPALRRALDMEVSDDFVRSFVILSDGYVTVEKEAFDLIRNNLNEANFFSFGIGTSVNRLIIDGIAYVGEGTSFVVTDYSEADEIAMRFNEYIERPVLRDIEANFNNLDVYDVEPLTIPDVFAERPVIVYGKYRKPAQGHIFLTGEFAGGQVTSFLDFNEYDANSDENIALKYLWARKRIKLMSDYGIASNETDTVSIEEEITQLGLKYSLVTDYTSFVAVDSCATTDLTETDPNELGDDLVSDVFDVQMANENIEKGFLKILGNPSATKGNLKVQIENLESLVGNDFSLRITDINGHTLLIEDIDSEDLKEIIKLPIGRLYNGFYFLSLISKNEVVDTEKFVIASY